MNDAQHKALSYEIARTKAYFPFRIVWGYIDDEGKPAVFANPTRRQMNAAIRAGKTVYAPAVGKPTP